MFIKLLLLITAIQTENSFPCEQILSKVHSAQGENFSWDTLTDISQELSKKKLNLDNCNSSALTKTSGHKLQNIFGHNYVWKTYLDEENKVCYELIEPDIGFLYDNDHYLFQCFLNYADGKGSNFATHELNEVPPENKCGSSYYYAEIIDNKVVYKDSCGNLKKGTVPD